MDYEIVKERYKYKNYAHFDAKCYPRSLHKYISNKDNIVKHAFYPFIHYSLKTKKFNKKNNNHKVKERSIYYSAHIDRYIYQYYSYLVNEAYNNYAIDRNINKSAIAYRTNHDGMCNIHYAKEAFDFIKKNDDCYILVGDLESFFDTLGHENLKKRLACVLDTDYLDNDIYAVFKSLTRFSYIEFDAIQTHYKINNKFSNREFKKLDRYLDDNFNQFKQIHLKKHQNNKEWKNMGIPQGTPLSGVLSNVYMSEFDEALSRYTRKQDGLYQRYSDDFIIIIKKDKISGIQELYNFVNMLISHDSFLTIQQDKFRLYESGKDIYEVDISNFTKKKNLSSIDYLGFTFDGHYAFLRDKTISKFYYKAYGYVDLQLKIEAKQIKKGKITRRSKKKIFLKYTEDGSSTSVPNSRGNFVTYLKRCNTIMNDDQILFDDRKFLVHHRNKIIKRLSHKQ